MPAFRHLDHLVLGLINGRDGDRNYEIAAAQQLIEELELSGQQYTLDALQCQKIAAGC